MKTEDQSHESLPHPKDTAMQSEEDTKHTKANVAVEKELQLTMMIEEMLLENRTLSDIAETELLEAKHLLGSDISVDGTPLKEESEERVSIPVDTQTLEPTVSDDHGCMTKGHSYVHPIDCYSRDKQKFACNHTN